ncbi:hypothetical protein [Clostridium cadaveris]
MKYEEVKKLINNVIENEFRSVEEENLKDLDTEVLNAYKSYSSEIIRLQEKIQGGLSEELKKDFYRMDSLLLDQLCIEIAYYFKKGVIAGTTNLSFLKDTNMMGTI